MTTTTQWFKARKQTGKKAWTEVLQFKDQDLIEFELAFEDAGVRTVQLLAGRVVSVQSATKNGQTIEVTFIGSNDPEIVDEFPLGTILNVHLDQMTARQEESKVTADDLLHSEHFRRVSPDEFRALAYIPRTALLEHVPAPTSSKAMSLRSGVSKRGPELKGAVNPAQTPQSKRKVINVEPSPDHLFKNLADLAAGMHKPQASKRKLGAGTGLSDSESDADITMEGAKLSMRADAAEVHKRMPGKLGFEMVYSIAGKELAEEDFKPCVRSHSLTIIKAMGSDQQKHKAACRELVTTARTIDHLVTHLIGEEKNGTTADFSPKNINKHVWKSLDVLGQRWQALEYVLATQMEKPDIPVAKLWDTLKLFELEPPLSSSTINQAMLSQSVANAAREDRLFSKIRGERAAK